MSSAPVCESSGKGQLALGNGVQPPKATGAALLALTDRAAGKAAAKGAGKGAKGTKPQIPKGIKSKTDAGEMVCFAYNQGRKCEQNPCTFKHVCWWCLGNHPAHACTSK